MRKAVLLAAAVMGVWGLVAFVTGGIDIRIAGIAIRARGAFRPLLIGFVLVAIYAILHPQEFERVSARAGSVFSRAAAVFAVALALLLGADAVVNGSFSAGGADSYGYVSQAYGWTAGELPKPIPLPLTLPFPSSDVIQIPLGYRTGPGPHTMVPTYAPGLPLLMAVGTLVGGPCGPFFVTPICAAILVWSTFVLARRSTGPAG